MREQPGRRRKNREEQRWAKQVASRLRDWIRDNAERYGGSHEDSDNSLAEAFAFHHDLAPSTVKRWLSADPPKPDASTLARIALAEGISLDWLLLDIGPRIREPVDPHETLPKRLYAAALEEYLREFGGSLVLDESCLPDPNRMYRWVMNFVVLHPKLLLPDTH